MRLWPHVGERATRAESHAYLDGLLPPPYAEWTAAGELAAFAAGQAEAEISPRPYAECREVPEEGTGATLYEVHDPGGPREPREPTPAEQLDTARQRERDLLDAKEQRLRDERDRLQQAARIAALEAELRSLREAP